MKLGRAIKLCRVQRQLSQADLAAQAGISVSYLSLLERDKRDPNISTIERISEALNIPLSILVFLAMDRSELSEISAELAEKLSYTALSLVQATNDTSANLSGA
jgi:transcriptional regulator with XRE-family HTH domain